MARYDMKYTNGALDISSGDISIVPSDEQHIEDTINAFAGWWKEFPFEGVGILAWLGGSINTQAIQRAIRINLEADNYTVGNPTVTVANDGKVTINPDANI